MTAFQRRFFAVSYLGRDPAACTCQWVRIVDGAVECVQCGHRETMEEYKARCTPKDP